MIKAMEFGIQKRTLSRLYTKRPVCVNRQNFQSIGIDDCLPAIMILPYGFLLAAAVGVIEKLYKLRKQNEKLCLKF